MTEVPASISRLVARAVLPPVVAGRPAPDLVRPAPPAPSPALPTVAVDGPMATDRPGPQREQRAAAEARVRRPAGVAPTEDAAPRPTPPMGVTPAAPAHRPAAPAAADPSATPPRAVAPVPEFTRAAAAAMARPEVGPRPAARRRPPPTVVTPSVSPSAQDPSADAPSTRGAPLRPPERAGPGPVPARPTATAVPATDVLAPAEEQAALVPAPPPAAPTPVVIGQIAVHVTAPAPPPDPFAGCREVADGLTARRGGGW